MRKTPGEARRKPRPQWHRCWDAIMGQALWMWKWIKTNVAHLTVQKSQGDLWEKVTRGFCLKGWTEIFWERRSCVSHEGWNVRGQTHYPGWRVWRTRSNCLLHVQRVWGQGVSERMGDTWGFGAGPCVKGLEFSLAKDGDPWRFIKGWGLSVTLVSSHRLRSNCPGNTDLLGEELFSGKRINRLWVLVQEIQRQGLPGAGNQQWRPRVCLWHQDGRFCFSEKEETGSFRDGKIIVQLRWTYIWQLPPI